MLQVLAVVLHVSAIVQQVSAVVLQVLTVLYCRCCLLYCGCQSLDGKADAGLRWWNWRWLDVLKLVFFVWAQWWRKILAIR